MNIHRCSQAHNMKCIVVLLQADVTVMGKLCCVTMQVAYCDSVVKSSVTLQF